MRLVIAGAAAWVRSGYGPLLNAGHKIIAVVNTPQVLQVQATLERPDALVVTDDLGLSSEALRSLLISLNTPAVVRGIALDLGALATPVAADAGWPGIVAALGTVVAPDALAVAQPPASPENTPASSPVIAPISAPVSPSATPRRLVIYPALGGVGASTLAATLAASVTEAGVAGLAVTCDPLAFAVGWGVPLSERNQVRQIAPRLSAAVVADGWRPASSGAFEVWDMGHSDGSVPGESLILTRPTGAGRLATVNLARRVMPARVILIGPGTLTAPEFARLCADYGVRVQTSVLPYDEHVLSQVETLGHALDTPVYGPAVRALARSLRPELPWPVEAEPTWAARDLPVLNLRRLLPRVELVE